MRLRLRDLRSLAKFKVEQRARRRQQPSPSEASDDDAPVESPRWAGLTWEQQQQAQALLERAQRLRGPLKGARYAGRIAGIKRAVLSGVGGESAWGRSMHGKRGGNTTRDHAPHILRANQPKATDAARQTRQLKKRRDAYDRDRARGAPLPVSPRLRLFPEA